MLPREDTAALNIMIQKWVDSHKTVDKTYQLDDLRRIIDEHILKHYPQYKFFIYPQKDGSSVEVIFSKDKKLVKRVKILLPLGTSGLPVSIPARKINVEEFIWSIICRQAPSFKVSWVQRGSVQYSYFSEFIPNMGDFANLKRKGIQNSQNIVALASFFQESAIRNEDSIFTELVKTICRNRELNYLISHGTRDAKLEWPLIDAEKKNVIIKYVFNGRNSKLVINVEKMCSEIMKRVVFRAYYGHAL
jgi:hypothetical protein